MEKNFKWYEFDINDKLPIGWAEEVINLANIKAKLIILTPKSITSRESDLNEKIETYIVDGFTIKENLPWLYDLYQNFFYEMAKKCISEPLYIANNTLYAINLNIQKGAKMRYECHVDSNPLQGLLYVTTHLKGTGGELVVSNIEDAYGKDEIEKNCKIIYPIKGHLIFFDARKNPHYVKPLINDEDIRIAITMNFYTASSPEEQRPEDLNIHLFGK